MQYKTIKQVWIKILKIVLPDLDNKLILIKMHQIILQTQIEQVQS
jgi:hypothetical protein